MAPSQPLWWSWPSLRHGCARVPEACGGGAGASHAPTRAELAAWTTVLEEYDDSLVVCSESLRLLPSDLPYELLGPALLVALDARVADCRGRGSALNELRLVSLDVQEPLSGPLSTCFAAFSCLQSLSLAELNVDTPAATALGQLLCGGRISGLSLQGVFLCETAWQGLFNGLAAGVTGLHTLRLIDSLSHAALEALTSSLPGCRQLKHLDLSSNRLSDTCGSGSNTAAGQACDAEDAAWARLVAALAQCCPDLEALHASGSSLGPLAAAALAKLMRVRDCKLGRLHLDSCTSIGLDGATAVASAAAAGGRLQLLDLSNAGLTDSSARPLFASLIGPWAALSSSCRQLSELRLGGSRLSAASAAAIARAVALAAALAAPACGLRRLDLSGCEISDVGAAALADAVLMHSSAEQRSVARLTELMLADNSISCAGVACFAAALRRRPCTLQLLDISHCWAGPRSMLLLVETAAEAAPALKLLHECSHEQWRVEAAKTAAADAAGSAEAVALASEACPAELASLPSSSSNSSSSNGSCCSQAGSSLCRCSDDSGWGAMAAAQLPLARRSSHGIAPGAARCSAASLESALAAPCAAAAAAATAAAKALGGTSWFNSLFDHEDVGGLSRAASSVIGAGCDVATAVEEEDVVSDGCHDDDDDAASDVCRVYAESEVSGLSSSICLGGNSSPAEDTTSAAYSALPRSSAGASSVAGFIALARRSSGSSSAGAAWLTSDSDSPLHKPAAHPASAAVAAATAIDSGGEGGITPAPQAGAAPAPFADMQRPDAQCASRTRVCVGALHTSPQRHVPRPPATPSSGRPCVGLCTAQCSPPATAGSGGAVHDAAAGTPSPGLKALRSMRRRVGSGGSPARMGALAGVQPRAQDQGTGSPHACVVAVNVTPAKLASPQDLDIHVSGATASDSCRPRHICGGH